MSDPNSHSNIAKVHTLHLAWLVNSISFEHKIIGSTAFLYLRSFCDKLDKVVLDTRDLKINGVAVSYALDPFWTDTSNGKDGQSQWSERSKVSQPDKDTFHGCKYTFGLEHAAFGSALMIDLPKPVEKGSVFVFRIEYQTSPKSSAIQWLSKEQTASKSHPYLFTQCQAIHARSLIPCQDTPAVKFTYSAEVRTDDGLAAVMSALLQQSSSNKFEFSQPVPIPSYLIALAVGNLESRNLGPRSKVWSEPATVDSGAHEFTDTESFISTAESLVSKYVWNIYDLLLMPPSFPYGGMENPCLTFVTPSIVAGDKSLVDVVAHEIAHSWAGNLVSNCNWQHFWLNEGFCVFIERKILGRMHGEEVRQFKSILGWKHLEESVQLFGADNMLTCLELNLENVDPDDAFSSVPYEKGYNLLYYLESILGGPSVFEPYLRAHFEHFAYQSISTSDWKSYLYEYFQAKHPEMISILDSVDWETWLRKPGMPPCPMPFDCGLLMQCESLVTSWISSSLDLSQCQKMYITLSTDQKQVFFDLLLEQQALPHDKLEQMSTLYQLKGVGNLEIKFRWLQVCLKAKYVKVIDEVEKVLSSVGRMKFIRPLYRSLAALDKNRARDIFAKYRDSYHPIASQMVEKDLLK